MNQTSAQSTAAGHPMELVPPDKATLVEFDELHQKLVEICRRHTAEDEAAIIADKIVLAEKMHIPTHGLHYFLHSILPHVQAGRVNDAPLRESGQIVVSEGVGGVGFGNLHRCLARASDIARDTGISLVVLKMPGKVGALRVFCHDLMDRGQLVMMVKNTARTVGLPETGQPSFGTNPLCIGLPGTRFIYDSSIATVATNKIRLARKTGQKFPAPIGVDADLQPTADPAATVDAGGYLLPFSFGPYWFKSFFLGVAIEAMAALAGGSTGSRVGEHTGKRLHSREGMLAVVIDSSAFPEYDHYADEVTRLLAEIEELGLHIPGDYDLAAKSGRVFTDDWRALTAL